MAGTQFVEIRAHFRQRGVPEVFDKDIGGGQQRVKRAASVVRFEIELDRLLAG